MKICCVGAGAAGIACAKTMKEKGHDVTVFERRDDIGGLWYFQESGVSVSRETTATSSRFYLQYSDFPMDDDLPHFVRHSQYIEYLKKYIAVHQLETSIHLQSEVLDVEPVEGGKWRVSIGEKDGRESDHIFDAVAICSGLHRSASLDPAFAAHTGEVLHASQIKDISLLAGKKVLVVGGGENGAELAHAAAQVGGGAGLSLKRGITVLAPYYPFPLHGRSMNPYFAAPADLAESRFLNLFSDKLHAVLATLEPYVYAYDRHDPGRHNAFHTLLTLLIILFTPLILVVRLFAVLTRSLRAFADYLSDAGVFSWRFWFPFLNEAKPWAAPQSVGVANLVRKFQSEGKRPIVTRDYSTASSYMARAARFAASGYSWRDYRRIRSGLEYYAGGWHRANFYTKSDDFIYDIMSGRLRVFPKIRSIDGRTITFENDDTFEADVLVACTGYKTEFPFLKRQVTGRDLFKNVFLPDVANLAFVGFARPEIGAMPPIAELQSRWVEAVFSGACKLPGAEEMKRVIAADNEKARSVKVFADRLTHSVRFISYMDEIARLAGCSIRYRTLLTKPKLLLRVFFGPALPTHYWLSGPKAKAEWAANYITTFDPARSNV
jgi:hypothetical protein